jgi:hypothetical protein
MKGVIVDKKGRFAVLLTTDGRFIKIANKADYKIGFEVELNKVSRNYNSLLARVSSIAAVFLFALGLTYGVYSYTMPYSYVDLDINPSIELTANVYDVIIKAETLNDDGDKLLGNKKLKYKNLGKGIEELIDSAVQQKYLKEQSENAILLTVIGNDIAKLDKLSKNLEAITSQALDDSMVKSEIITQQINEKEHKDTKDVGLSQGKLKLIEKVIANEPDLKLDELKDEPVKNIVKKLKESKDKIKGKNNESDNSLDENEQNIENNNKLDEKDISETETSVKQKDDKEKDLKQKEQEDQTKNGNTSEKNKDKTGKTDKNIKNKTNGNSNANQSNANKIEKPDKSKTESGLAIEEETKNNKLKEDDNEKNIKDKKNNNDNENMNNSKGNGKQK